MRSIYLLLLLVALFTANCFGEDIYLVEGGNGTWHDPNSWDVGRVPDANDDVYIDLSNVCEINEPAEANNLYIGIDANAIGNLNVRNTLDVRSNIVLGVNFASSGTIAVFTLGEVTADYLKVSQDGDGSLALFGGIARIEAVGQNGIISLDHGYLLTDEIRTESDESGLISLNRGHIGPYDYIVGDLNGNGCLNFRDFAIMADRWLEGCQQNP